jgi:hypothetical protein
MQCRHVRKSDEWLGHGQPRQFREQPHGPVPAAGAQHGLGFRIGEGGGQFRQPQGIIARKVAVALEYALVVSDVVTLADDGETGLERGAVEGPCRRDDGDGVRKL